MVGACVDMRRRSLCSGGLGVRLGLWPGILEGGYGWVFTILREF